MDGVETSFDLASKTAAMAQWSGSGKENTKAGKMALEGGGRLYNNLYAEGENTVKGYIKGINENSGELSQAVVKMVNEALKAGNKAAKIKSPSRKTLWSGRMLAQGWIKGVTKEDPAGQIVKTVKYGTSSIQDAMNRDLKLNMHSTIESNMGNIGAAMVSSLAKAALTVSSSISQ